MHGRHGKLIWQMWDKLLYYYYTVIAKCGEEKFVFLLVPIVYPLQIVIGYSVFTTKE